MALSFTELRNMVFNSRSDTSSDTSDTLSDLTDLSDLSDDIDQIDFSYLADVGEETLRKEHKVFSFNLIGLELDYDDVNMIVETNMFDLHLNSKVLAAIEKYLDYYPAKYLSGFFNAGISAKLLIGPDDWGTLHGIPIKAELDIADMTSKFYSSLESKIRNDKFTGNIKDYVKINFVKLEYSPEELVVYIGKQHPTYTKYLAERAKYKELVRAQRDEYNTWKARNSIIRNKLVDLLNGFYDTRILILNYVRTIEPANSVIMILETNEQIESLSPDEIASIVSDNTNPYHWASKWRDYMCEVLRIQRPDITKIIFPEFNTPFNLINSVTNMIPYWLANNSNMNLYAIEIAYTYDKQMDRLGKWIYLDKNSKYVSCTRVIKSDGEPANFPD
jgi:hypothetical protein